MHLLSALTQLAALGRLANGFPLGVDTFVTRDIPSQAQRINQRDFNVLKTVLPPIKANGTTIQTLGFSEEALANKPFHIYDDAFLAVLGSNPTLTLIASSPEDPLFHEAPIWYPPTDEVFFAQNSGAPSAGTGLNKSAIIQKISLSQAGAVTNLKNATGKVDIVTVGSNASVQVINPNGGTNYKSQLLWVGDGQGDNGPPSMYIMNPKPPYNSTVILDNFFGRQFNSIDDVAVHPKTGEIYFTDPGYGYLQDFRPAPGLPYQVYRFNASTGAVAVAADGFDQPNGVTFSPDGTYVYITDTGMQKVFYGTNMSNPATIYRFDVKSDGTFENRKTFAYAGTGVPDGIHCDSNGNVYAGCGDGVNVFNPSGKLIGKIYIGTTSANFQFAGQGRMVLLGETDLYYVTLAASGVTLEF